MSIWIIVYLVIAYLFMGAVFSAFLKAAGYKDDDSDEGGMWKIPTTLFWPAYVVLFIIVGIFLVVGAFIDYLAKQITKKED